MATGVLRPGTVLALLLAGPVTGCGSAESARQGCAARAGRRRGEARAADALIERRVSAGCAELYRTGTPTKGHWQ
jgi:hypothetical protein